jgi:hypothetical protein
MNIIELANESGLTYYGMGKDRARFIHYLEVFAALVAAHEREECAKICDDGYFAFIAADIIRERGTT